MVGSSVENLQVGNLQVVGSSGEPTGGLVQNLQVENLQVDGLVQNLQVV